MSILKIIVVGCSVGIIAAGDSNLAFEMAVDLINFTASSGGALVHDPSGGASGNGAMSLLGGDTRTAFLTSEQIDLSHPENSISMTVDVGPLVLSSVDQSFTTVAAIGLVPITKTDTSLVATTQDPRFAVLLTTVNNAETYDCRFVLESYDAGRQAFAGSSADLVPGNFYRWWFTATRQAENSFLLESKLIDLGADGAGNEEVLSASSNFINTQMGLLSLYSGFSRGGSAAYINEINAYTQELVKAAEPSLRLVVIH